ncbi:MAG: ATP-binding protein [Deltaproteobacteria bacterium]|nr:MAG: ATP-binding protein [Deltaproteobacteria bacterium]
MSIPRLLQSQFPHFLGKLIFIYGPRQVGKTFIITEYFKPDWHLNMDIAEDRKIFREFPSRLKNWIETQVGLKKTISFKDRKVVFIDEVHKVKGWRNLLKGAFDQSGHLVQLVASGSSAVQLRKQDQGDSLAGRAAWLEMTPVTFREYVLSRMDIKLPPVWNFQKDLLSDHVRKVLPFQKELRLHWENFSRFGSFPDNLVSQSQEFYSQWLKDYTQAMLERDLKDLHMARDVDRVHHVFELLLEGVVTPYAIRSIAQALEVSPDTIKKDIRAIQTVMWGSDVETSHLSRSRQIRKEKKFYPSDWCFLDYVLPQAEGARFECQVVNLFQRTTAKQCMGYYRDYEKREVDVVIRDRKNIYLAAEVKTKPASNHLSYFVRQFSPREAFLIVEAPGIFEKRDDYFVVSAELLAVL